MEAVKSGDKKRVLPAWMTTQETPKPKRAVQGAAAARLPAMRTAYCMSEAEMVDVALGILIEDFPKLASTTVVCIFVKYGVKQPPTWSAQELPAASLTRHQKMPRRGRRTLVRGQDVSRRGHQARGRRRQGTAPEAGKPMAWLGDPPLLHSWTALDCPPLVAGTGEQPGA
ncbi:cell cycle regulator of non-homologous end joining isoform X3 [Canis lupus baileyi]|uniref:cell cycle regulator of non-homologous end joining isoform X4 n=1 Tax=Canis lupus familiaris TaxID=9615 RepID=UPI000DC6BBB5|nr:cell cycle regulator of non-homologous end joining isoform X4 [Canis lupus familiaris]XP_048951162.1 cell cycle regulator of non-homologous end joining isoform X4 [Canis lupus dingo]